jgi:hypothetical protein
MLQPVMLDRRGAGLRYGRVYECAVVTSSRIRRFRDTKTAHPICQLGCRALLPAASPISQASEEIEPSAPEKMARLLGPNASAAVDPSVPRAKYRLNILADFKREEEPLSTDSSCSPPTTIPDSWQGYSHSALPLWRRTVLDANRTFQIHPDGPG